MLTEAYRPTRNIRKQLHINLQIFLGEDSQTPPPHFSFATPPPTFVYKNGYTLKSLQERPWLNNINPPLSHHNVT